MTETRSFRRHTSRVNLANKENDLWCIHTHDGMGCTGNSMREHLHWNTSSYQRRPPISSQRVCESTIRHLWFLPSYAILACLAYDTSMTSVFPSVTLVNYDHILQRKLEIHTCQVPVHHVGRCLGLPACQSDTNQNSRVATVLNRPNSMLPISP